MAKPCRQRSGRIWPALPYEAWKDTCATLHLWTQIVGKIRLAQTPWINHSWHVTLYVTPRGLTTSPIPRRGRAFQIDFDFIDHALVDPDQRWRTRRLALEPQSVAEFYDQLLATLAELGVRVRSTAAPTRWRIRSRSAKTARMPPTMRRAQRFWRVLLQVDRVFKQFRTRFLGKSARCTSSGAASISR